MCEKGIPTERFGSCREYGTEKLGKKLEDLKQANIAHIVTLGERTKRKRKRKMCRHITGTKRADNEGFHPHALEKVC